jgi:hypothetical protein
LSGKFPAQENDPGNIDAKKGYKISSSERMRKYQNETKTGDL